MKSSRKSEKALDLAVMMNGKTLSYGSIKIWTKAKFIMATTKRMGTEHWQVLERRISLSRECKSGVWVPNKTSKISNCIGKKETPKS
jgi:hypothetical protein